MGTVLALEYALRHPEHVSRRVLMDPAPMWTEKVLHTITLRRDHPL